jgi:hypothetical protein
MVPDIDVFSLYEDARGGVWVGSSAGVYYRPDGGRFGLRDKRPRFVQSFAEDESGTLWVNDSETFVRALSPDARPHIAAGIHLPGSGSRLLRDQHGTVWLRRSALPFQPGADGRPAPKKLRTQVRRRALRLRGSGEEHLIGMRGGGLLRLSQSPAPMSNWRAYPTACTRSRRQAIGGIWVATATP